MKKNGILTVTPNPALDLGGVVQEIIPDEKNYVEEETRHPGGNAINAARMMTHLGVPVVATGFLGGGVGQEIRDLLDKEHVHHQFVTIRECTRTSVTVSNRETLRQTRLSFPGPNISLKEAKELEYLIGKLQAPAILVLGGSLPQRYPPSRLLSLIRLARRKSLFVVVDVPSKVLKSVVRGKPHLIKPNLSEFCDLIQKRVQTKEEVLRYARVLTKNVPLLCISSVEGGALFVTPKSAWFGKGPKVDAKSSVGAGDSMVGAITAQIWKNDLVSKKGLNLDLLDSKVEEIFRWGLSAAMATVMTPGTELGKKDQIKPFLRKIEIQKIDDCGV